MHAVTRFRNDRGQAVMLVLAMVAALAVMLMAMARFSVRLVETEQAQLAADAAALAGVVQGRSGAVALAERNGARVVEFRQVGDDVIVVVECGGARATSRATRAP
jgi:type II secretory pathway component PulK